eukprot:357952-Rhodomonas_salina.1
MWASGAAENGEPTWAVTSTLSTSNACITPGSMPREGACKRQPQNVMVVVQQPQLRSTEVAADENGEADGWDLDYVYTVELRVLEFGHVRLLERKRAAGSRRPKG